MSRGKTTKRAHPEADLQKKVVKYIMKFYGDIIVMNAPLGELQTSIHRRAEAKRMGYVAGIPDLMIFNQTLAYNGLAIELKIGSNTTSPAQDEFIDKLREQHWCVHVVYNYDVCCEVIDQYMDKVESYLYVKENYIPFPSPDHQYQPDQ